MATQTINKEVTLTSTLILNSTTLTTTSTAGVVPGATLVHAKLQSGTVVSSVTNATTIVMSKTATSAGSSQAVVATNPEYVNVDAINRGTWASNDTLVINEGQKILVNTTQTKFWNTITINDGTFRVENTSTTTGIRFLMGRSTGIPAANNTPCITPSASGNVEIEGDWISLGTGNGGSQDFVSTFQDYIAAVWVETAPSSGVYDIWLNMTTAYGQTDGYRYDGLNGLSVGDRIRFFRQLTNDEPYTAGNTVSVQFTTTLRFGEELNIIPAGCNVRIPNIMMTNATANNYLSTNSWVDGGFKSINLTSGGSLSIDTALFDIFQVYVNEAIEANFYNCAFTMVPTLVGTPLIIDGMGIVPIPSYRYSQSSVWKTYWNYGYNNNLFISYCDNSILNNISIYTYCSSMFEQQYNIAGVITISHCNNITASNLTIYSTNPINQIMVNVGSVPPIPAEDGGQGSCGLLISYTKYSEFSNVKCYGEGIILTKSDDNIIDGIKVSSYIYNCSNRATSVTIDPNTGNDLIADTPYYFKVRAYYNNFDLTDYYENPVVYSVTPYDGHGAGRPMHPYYFNAVLRSSVTNPGQWEVLLNWMQSPSPLLTYATLAYDIYRGTTPGFTRSSATKLYTTATATTVTITDNAALLLGRVANNTTYYYALRKYNSAYSATTCTGTSGQFTLNRTAGFGAIKGTVPSCNLLNNSTKVTSFISEFMTLGVVAGMVVTGTGIPANTTVVSVNEYYEIIISNPANQTILGVTLTFGVGVGMAVTGTNIAIGATVTVINSDTQVTLSAAHTGTVSTTAIFISFTESAEQIVTVPNFYPVYPNWLLTTNMCTYSNMFSAWTLTSATALDACTVSPGDIFDAQGIYTAGYINYTVASGSATQIITTVIGTTYTFSVYLKSFTEVTGRTVNIKCGTASTSCSLTQKWKRFSVTFTATAISTTVGIYATAISKIYAYIAQMEANTVPKNAVRTDTPTATLGYPQITLRSINKNGHKNIQITSISGYDGLFYSIFMGTTTDFIPSKKNMIYKCGPDGVEYINIIPIIINLSNRNILKNITKEGYGNAINETNHVYIVSPNVGTSNNSIINMDYDSSMSCLIPINIYYADNTYLHNINLGKILSTTSPPISIAGNNTILSSIKTDNCDYPVNYAVTNKNITMKGISGTNSIQTAFTSATDGIIYSTTTVYDKIFHEFYTSATEGNFTVLFNPSVKKPKPYEVVGTPKFSNNATSSNLYIRYLGDSVTYTWPHKIYGVSGFQDKSPLVSTLDYGTNTRNGILLYKEYCISLNGTTYGNWKEMTGSNLHDETVSATDGFYFKFRLSPRVGLRFDGQTTNNFIGGESINGQTSGATATITAVDDDGASGTITLSNIVGTFANDENLRIGTTVYAVANGTLIQPVATSYINGLRIYTTIDRTISYPEAYYTLTLNNLVAGSQIDIIRVSDGAILYELSSSTTSCSWSYGYFGVDIPVKIIIQSLNYNYLSIPYSLTDEAVTIPIQQQIDRNYSNPV